MSATGTPSWREARVVVSIKQKPGPHEIVPGVGPDGDCAAVGHMAQRRMQSMICQRAQRRFIALDLVRRVRVIQNFRRGEMTEDAFEFNLRQTLQAFGERIQFRQRQSQAGHAGIDLEMDGEPLCDTDMRGGAREIFDLLQSKTAGVREWRSASSSSPG